MMDLSTPLPVYRMPVLVESIRCPYCGKNKRVKHVYAVGTERPWRCWACLRLHMKAYRYVMTLYYERKA